MQQSISSGALESIPLSYQERRIDHLHEEIDRLIGVANVPEALPVPPRLEPFWEIPARPCPTTPRARARKLSLTRFNDSMDPMTGDSR